MYFFLDGFSATDSVDDPLSEPDRLSRLLWPRDDERCLRCPLDVEGEGSPLADDRERWRRAMAQVQWVRARDYEIMLEGGRSGEPRDSVGSGQHHLSSHGGRIIS